MNYLGIVLAAVASIIVGMLWYGPLFGKMWIKGMRFSPKQMKDMKKDAKKSYPGMVVNSLVMAGVLWKVLGLMGITAFADSVAPVFWLWLGFVATVQFGGVLWEGRSKDVFFINTANSLVSLWVMAWVLLAF